MQNGWQLVTWLSYGCWLEQLVSLLGQHLLWLVESKASSPVKQKHSRVNVLFFINGMISLQCPLGTLLSQYTGPPTGWKCAGAQQIVGPSPITIDPPRICAHFSHSIVTQEMNIHIRHIHFCKIAKKNPALKTAAATRRECTSRVPSCAWRLVVYLSIRLSQTVVPVSVEMAIFFFILFLVWLHTKHCWEIVTGFSAKG